jgi:hypothetical protein
MQPAVGGSQLTHAAGSYFKRLPPALNATA